MMRRFVRYFSNLESQEDTFKLYIRKAEEIDQEVKQRAEILRDIRESMKGPTEMDQITKFIRESKLLDKLFACRSSEKLQLVLEDAYHSVSKSYKSEEDTKKPELTPGSLTEKLMFIWDERPEIRMLDTPLIGLLRSMWVNGMTSSENIFGSFKRITKPIESNHSPFFYGEIGDSIYLSLIKGTGKSPGGVQVIRRVLDHMSAFEHVPSQELAENIIKECITGKWPRALWTAIEFCPDIPSSVWEEVIQFYRFTNGYFEKAIECVSKAIEKKCPPSSGLIKPILHKYLQHGLASEASELLESHVQTIIKKVKGQDGNTKELQAEAIAQCYWEYCSMLLDIERETPCKEVYEKYMKDKTPKNETSYRIGFLIHERTENTKEGLEYFEQFKNNKTVGFTPKIVISVLKMAMVFRNHGKQIVEDIEGMIFKREDLYSPFALNLIIIYYGRGKEWEKLAGLLGKVVKGYKVNKFTEQALQKQVDSCLAPDSKGKILQFAQELNLKLT